MELPQQDISLRQIVEWGAEQFDAAGLYFGHGTDNALDELAWLVAHVLKLPLDYEGVDVERLLSDTEKSSILTLMEKRIQERKPLAYLIHEAWFYGLPFYVDERVLVPRSPIAELIADGFQPWLGDHNVGHILEIGAGSACIAIACALAFPNARVDAADISADAMDVARINQQRYELEDRLELIQSDLFSALQGRRYDIIVSNPPYVDAEDMASLPEEFRHEPELGLTAGQDGLELVIPMLAQASDYLNPDGILIVEVGNSQPALEQRFPEVPFMWLEFEYGGQGVFMLDAATLAKHRHEFEI
ncbi:MAG: 50S ribosomal protein L3 N(5)-glutamine methyltransferase [Gammaproteobacteria bacterium]|nr:50S ribosomal protein L3 N(5)-glutamine methyltransferase [Gammaproteobacteria bacterium]